jgi:small subunit ribosomal protein S21
MEDNKKKNNYSEGSYVEVRNNNVERALKQFKRKIKDNGLMLEIKRREYYEKPSDIRRRKRNLGKIRQKYKTIRENEGFF